jgi:hypothetical protein
LSYRRLNSANLSRIQPILVIDGNFRFVLERKSNS